MRRSSAALSALLLAFGLIATPSTANADPWWAHYFLGPYPDQVSCDADSTAFRSPPEFQTWPCGYFTSEPRGGSRGPGWYFYVLADIR
ncbi:hypothetical protein [Actinokineospora sp. NBRC 105648]|uniref:hypothetical protein n=1 Tax=Actinokineospora sp. NBRC 105648 TaxID=3032206 RepID=UPI0024A17A48|nr:hypothetical protein [Actinokineospora sp. NBRC 105648]GLZ42868.1 hypothetical protein Acsp05_64920 [Actinokineospora sp. NBRC 105648]